MKNLTTAFSIASLFIMASCGETKVEETQTTPPATTETTVNVNTETPAASKPATKSTEIIINKDGSKIETKDGKSETNIELSKDKAGVVIKR